MRIAFVIPRFYPCRGGYENYTLALASDLVSVGHAVSVFTTTAVDLEYFWLPEFKHLATGTEWYRGVEIRRFPICHKVWLRRAGRLLALLPSWQLKARFARPGYRVPGLERALYDFQPQVIHIGPLPYNSQMYSGIRVAKRTGAQVVATPCTHFGAERSTDVARHYTRPFQISLLRQCDRVFTLTSIEREKLCELGLNSDRVVVTGAGIDPETTTNGNAERIRRQLNMKGRIVLHLGMKAREKGTFTLIEAMQLLWNRGGNATLVLAGPKISEFDSYLRHLSLPERMFINLDAVSEAHKRDLLAAADIVVLPSRVESLGLVYLEAWANGKPVIAARIPTSQEIITDGEEGLLVPYGETEQLATAISFLLENPEQSRRMGENGKKKLLARFLWKDASKRLLSYIVNSSSHHNLKVQNV